MRTIRSNYRNTSLKREGRRIIWHYSGATNGSNYRKQNITRRYRCTAILSLEVNSRQVTWRVK